MKIALTVALGVGLLLGEPMTTVDRTISIAIEVPQGVVLALDHRYGNLAVTGVDGDSVVIDAKIAVSGRSAEQVQWLAEQTGIAARSGPETLGVMTVYPEVQTGDTTMSCEVDLKVSAPERSLLSVSNVFGDIQLRGRKELCLVSVRYGHLTMSNCVSAEVTGRYSDVSVSDLRGSLKVDNDFGNVLLREVSGEIRVANRYGRVEIESVRGSVRIDNSFGDVECRQDSGTLVVDNRVGDVRAWLASAQMAGLSLVSRVGRVELSLQPGAECRLRGRVRHGSVLSRFPLRFIEEGGWQYFTGLAGESGPEVELQTYNGDVVVRTETLKSLPAGRER